MIQFYPTPNYTYLSNVEVICQTALNGTLVPQDLVNKFNLYIDAGAEAFLYGMDGEPWFNPMLSEKAERYFIEGIGQARTWRDKGNQTGSVRATPRPFLAR
jgi:hypothetical protein